MKIHVSLLDTTYMNSMQSALNASLLRQQVYANNIANVNTPGYKREQVHFDSILQSQLAASGQSMGISTGVVQPLSLEANNTRDIGTNVGSATALGTVSPVVTTDSSTAIGGNGNNVNVDAEMSALAENQVGYGALVQDMNDQFSMLRTAILGS
ncbi:flagellar basal body rod protein FlgB [Sulfoacidibacillus ferrooxidans]|uniref:flagellar basal body rod protein FlgB n=1 Tax=Sulfoacidibacillus ferrooxidans TaxID=2005001 RepID=UPI001F50A78C